MRFWESPYAMFINIFNMQIGCSALVYLNLANAVVCTCNESGRVTLRHFKREMCGSG